MKKCASDGLANIPYHHFLELREVNFGIGLQTHLLKEPLHRFATYLVNGALHCHYERLFGQESFTQTVKIFE